VDFLKYIKAAFKNKWNVLAFAGGMGFAAISGKPEVAIPLVMAAEVGYLGLIGTHDGFRKHVDAQEHKKAKASSDQDAKRSLRKIMLALPRKSKDRYKELAGRCKKLRQIAEDLHATKSETLQAKQMKGLDRLLWTYLKLLYTEYSLNEFLKSTDEPRIFNEVNALKERIEREESRPANEQRQRILSTLKDDLKTCESRLSNYRKADQNHELVQLEIRRLENKIQTLGELAINRREPNLVSDQVNEVADDMLGTEKTLNELEFITGIHTEHDEAIPELVRRETIRTRR
jgi:chemotaxis protein histidine kinase CheA